MPLRSRTQEAKAFLQIMLDTRCKKEDAEAVQAIILSLELAEKFVLPNGGSILGWRDSKKNTTTTELIANYVSPFRLPYPTCTFEWVCTSEKMSSTSGHVIHYVIVLACELKTPEDSLVIAITTIYLINGRWYPAFFNVIVADDGTFTPLYAFKSIETKYNYLTQDQLVQLAAQETTNQVFVVAETLAALSCTNVETVKTEHTYINKKREAKGKLPLYDFHTLVLKPTGSENTAPFGGTHASPRMHLRRGHIRRLETGNVWVNSCVVGSAQNGVIEKNYSIAS